MARTPRADTQLMSRLRDADPAPPQPVGSLDERAEADLAQILATPTAVVPPPRRRPLALVAVAAAVLVISAVATTVHRLDDDSGSGTPTAVADTPSALASSPPVVEPPPDADELLAALGPQPAYDYPSAGSPSALAAGADLVAVGRLVALAPLGPGTGCARDGDEPPSTPGVVVRLDQLEVVKGEPSMVTALVEVPLAGGQALSTAFPLGTRVLVYAVDGLSADCQPVYRVRSLQGFAVQAAHGRVVWPLLGQVRDGDLSQALPGGTLIAR